eukprot:g6385.t1
MEKVKTVFEDSLFQFENEAPLHRCVLLLNEYFQSASELAEAYEIFTLQKGIKTKKVTEANLTKFESFHRKTSGGSIGRLPQTTAGVTEFSTPVKRPSVVAESERVSPKDCRSPTASPFLTPGRSFSGRKKKGQIVVCFNEHLTTEQIEESRRDQSVLRLKVIGPVLSPLLKLFDDKIESKIAYIENRISSFMEVVEKHYNIDLKTPVNQPSQDLVWVCGMICCDSDGRLNAKSMNLLGSQSFSSGASVVLDIAKLTDYSFFPGQIVAIEGQNLTGQCLVVSNLICNLPPKVADLEAPQSATGVTMLTASGPYSSSEDLGFAALTEILYLCEKQYFNFVILSGPFVDIRHPVLTEGHINLSFDEIYQQLVVPILAKIEVQCGQLVIVPGLDDANVLPVFPQLPFSADPELQKTSHWGNPCVFNLGSLMMGICSHDVIKSLSMSVCEQQTMHRKDRIGLLLKHILGQRSFYPVFPPMLGACLDSSLASFLDLPVSLDVLICPSDLQTFIKLVSESPVTSPEENLVPNQKSCLCINPGRVVRGSNGGTYAIITITEFTEYPMKVQDSIKVEIVGI